MTSPTFSLHGKVGLVTGAGRGIGKAIALALAEAGADVVAVARTGSEIEATAQEARALGRRVEAIEADISDPNDVEAMSRQARQRFERIDIVVNNAAASFFQPLVPLPGYDPPSELPAFRTPTTDEAWEEDAGNQPVRGLSISCGRWARKCWSAATGASSTSVPSHPYASTDSTRPTTPRKADSFRSPEAWLRNGRATASPSTPSPPASSTRRRRRRCTTTPRRGSKC